MRHHLTIIAALGAAMPLAAQDDTNDAAYGGRAATVSEEIVLSGGEALYRGVCQGCHQPDGSGAEGAGHYPALAGNENLAYPEYAISLVLHGQQAMPPFGDILSDEQIAEVVSYVQTAWGNSAESTATAEMVEDFREQ